MWQIIDYTQPNAPSVADGNGQLLTMLDACLIDGFNEQTAMHYADGVLTYGGLHGYIKNQYITIKDGMGENHYKIKEVSDTQVILYEKPKLSGEIKTKITPLGWESIFGNTDPLRRAYRSKNDKSTKTVLFLDMTYPAGHGYHATNPARRAMITLCEDMVELGVPINDYTASINNKSIHANGALFWHQKRAYSKNGRIIGGDMLSAWRIVGNGDFFYLFIDFGSGYDLFAFGNFGKFSRPVVGCLCVVSDNDNSGYYVFNGVRTQRVAGVAIIDGIASTIGISNNHSTTNHTSGTSQITYEGELVGLPMYLVHPKIPSINDALIVGYLPHLYFLPYNMRTYQGQWLDDMYIMPMGIPSNVSNGGAYGLYSPS